VIWRREGERIPAPIRMPGVVRALGNHAAVEEMLVDYPGVRSCFAHPWLFTGDRSAVDAGTEGLGEGMDFALILSIACIAHSPVKAGTQCPDKCDAKVDVTAAQPGCFCPR
jgi:hypothetical protein